MLCTNSTVFVSVFSNPCAAGNPARDSNQNIVTCSVANMAVCPSGFFCHIGATEQTTICCPGNANPCTEPRMPGTGDASLPRFVYNSLTQQCLPFIYTGIGGNQNNFLSRADCEARCPGESLKFSESEFYAVVLTSLVQFSQLPMRLLITKLTVNARISLFFDCLEDLRRRANHINFSR